MLELAKQAIAVDDNISNTDLYNLSQLVLALDNCLKEQK